MLLESKKSSNTVDVVKQYKQQMLSFIEYPTAAIYHATASVLQQLDKLQDQFPRDLGITR